MKESYRRHRGVNKREAESRANAVLDVLLVAIFVLAGAILIVAMGMPV